MTATETNIKLPFEQSHAFIIGINEYQHVTPLTTAVNDAMILAQLLEQEHGYQIYKNKPLLNPTKNSILQLFEDVPKLVKKDHRVLFYFAGHGIALNSDDDPTGYLVPADAKPGEIESLVSMDLLHDTIAKLDCKHGLLLLDCCFAGAFKWSTGFRDLVQDLPGVIYEERFNQYARDPAWQVITSAASDQKAADVFSNRTLGLRSETSAKHSPFALALFDGLSGEGDTIPKDKGDGVITVTELYSYLRDRVEDESIEKGMRQSPSLFSLKKHNKGQYIFLHPNHRLNLPPIPRRNPFMGLKSYNESDHNLFYGRDRVIDALEALIIDKPLVVVSGASGTGKSSVIKAGLLPLLRKKNWRILPVVRPGKEPLQSLKTAIPEESGLLDNKTPSVLIIDQYEELITQCLYPEKRKSFEETLLRYIKTYPQLRIVISIRSDFEPQFEEATLTKWWSKGRYVVPAFSQDELREIILKPTIQEVLFFEPEALVDRLVDAVNQAPGALPLLSFTLSELYHAYIESGRTDRAFTSEDYEKLGGVIGALRTRANSIYQVFDIDHQASMRKLMLRMVSFEGGELAGRRVLGEDLIFSDQTENKRIQQVADKLVDARLISSGVDHQGRAYYEPAHDALVRAWALLWEWIKALGEGKLELFFKLGLAVADYREHSRSTLARKYLWHNDPRLELLYGVVQSKLHSFNVQEETFVQKSMDLRKRNKRNRRFLVGCIMAVLLVLSGLAFWQRSMAKEEAARADEQATLAEIQKDSAVAAQERAEVARQEAIQSRDSTKEALLLADSLREKAEKALNELQQATGTIVDNILVEADEHILFIEYKEAAEKLLNASQLGAREKEVAEKLMEIAFVYFETGRDDEGTSLIQRINTLVGNSPFRLNNPNEGIKKQFRQALKSYSSNLWSTFMERYYPVMVPVAGGSFWMGCDEAFEGQCREDALPKRWASLSSFALAQTETSVWQYYLYTQANNLNLEPPTCWGLNGSDPRNLITWWDGIQYANWVSRSLELEPVYQISKFGEESESWQIQVNWEANGFRLPTETEWEYAARGGPQQSPYLYSGADSLALVACYQANSDVKGTPKAFAVASKNPNAVNIYDMSGNLFEWCWDWFGPYPEEAPKDYPGPAFGTIRVYRGGSWKSPPPYCKVSFRDRGSPNHSSLIHGLRLAKNDSLTPLIN